MFSLTIGGFIYKKLLHVSYLREFHENIVLLPLLYLVTKPLYTGCLYLCVLHLGFSRDSLSLIRLAFNDSIYCGLLCISIGMTYFWE